jgi:hypothetical protein
VESRLRNRGTRSDSTQDINSNHAKCRSNVLRAGGIVVTRRLFIRSPPVVVVVIVEGHACRRVASQ